MTDDDYRENERLNMEPGPRWKPGTCTWNWHIPLYQMWRKPLN